MARNIKVEELNWSSAAFRVGYRQLKHKQNKAVKEFVSSRDVIVSLPTGSSKSLCYAVLPAAVNAKSPLRTVVFDKPVRQAVQHCSLHIAMAAYKYGLLTHTAKLHNTSQSVVKRKPIQSCQTLLPPFPFAPPTNCCMKGLGHARLASTMVILSMHACYHSIYRKCHMM